MCRYNHLLGLFFLGIITLSFPVYAEDDFSKEISLLESTQFQLLGTNLGSLCLHIKAHEMCQYESGNVILTGGIEIIMLGNKSGKDEGPIHVKGNRLFYSKEKKLCTITGNVLLTKPEQQFKITTEQLSYDTNQEVIFTETPLVIVDRGHVLKANLLRATKDLTKYTVTGPSGTVDIEKESLLGGNPL